MNNWKIAGCVRPLAEKKNDILYDLMLHDVDYLKDPETGVFRVWQNRALPDAFAADIAPLVQSGTIEAVDADTGKRVCYEFRGGQCIKHYKGENNALEG